MRLNALSIDKICDDISQICSSEGHLNLSGISLDNANVCGKIDLLIGCDWYWHIVNGQILNHHPGLVAMNSSLGWLISGRQNSNLEHKNHVCVNIQPRTHDKIIVEEFDSDSELDDVMLKQFENTIAFENGRYSVSFPWRNGFKVSNNNYFVAKQRLQSTLRKLERENMLIEYDNIIQNYLSKEYIEFVENYTHDGYYLPHHAVLRLDKLTTKVRIVFDGSAKQGNSLSLNDCLYKGPCLLRNLVDLIYHFQSSPIVVLSDIQEAFLQININEQDRDFVKFLWVNANKELVTYRFTRVPFGLSCSPFLLNVTVAQHLKKLNITENAKFYVDDLILTSDTVEEASNLSNNIYNEMKKGGFTLRKWVSNENLLSNEALFSQSDIDRTKPHKVLGLVWNITSDVLFPDLSFVDHVQTTDNITKRNVLAIMSQVFDPMGYLSGFTILFRLLFQEVHMLKFDWDDALTPDIKSKFLKLLEDLKLLIDYKVQRPFIEFNAEYVELHCFCDASAKAYGAMLYIRGFQTTVKMQLLRTKARVCPCKKQTIPRLELMACVLACKLVSHFKEAMPQYINSKVFCWSDSMAAISWIKGVKQWPSYIENRVSLIRNAGLTDNFHYVKSEINPADQLSRGLNAKEFLNSKSWYHGPKFLYESGPTIVSSDMQFTFLIDSSAKNVKHNIFPNHLSLHVERFSSYEKLMNVARRCFEAISLFSKNKIAITDINSYVLRAIQYESLSEVYSKLKRGKTNELISKLNLFLDNHDVIRVKTRLGDANISFDVKHPILLPYDHVYTKLFIDFYHRVHLHCGARQTLANLRTKYWIIKGRKLVVNCLKNCVYCRKFNCKAYGLPAPPELPLTRTECSYPFENVGIDYAGPLIVKANITVRSKTSVKAYIALFTCAVTRAVHLELVLDLTSDSFIIAFKRFCARRGVPSYIISDNGTTFIKASKSIAKIINGSENMNKFVGYFTAFNIKWQFIVPRAPWWGGFYERMVQTVKRTIKKTIGTAHLNYFELETAIIMAEGVVNNRPLTYVYNDVHEMPAISPNDILLGRKMIDQSTSSSTCDVISCKRHMEYIRMQFWASFKNDYLLSLRERMSTQNNNEITEPQEGDVVHIKDQTSKNYWKLGRIKRLIKGRDNKVRAAEVATPVNGNNRETLTRAISQLYPLETKQKVNLSLSNSVLLMSMIIVSLLTFVSGNQNGLICKDLSCMQLKRGKLFHYNIYQPLDTIPLRSFVCSRISSKCEFFENFFGSKSPNCHKKYHEVTPKLALKWVILYTP